QRLVRGGAVFDRDDLDLEPVLGGEVVLADHQAEAGVAFRLDDACFQTFSCCAPAAAAPANNAVPTAAPASRLLHRIVMVVSPHSFLWGDDRRLRARDQRESR